MKSNWEHQKKATATDQKTRTNDEHIHEMDKQHLKESEKDSSFVPETSKKVREPEKE